MEHGVPIVKGGDVRDRVASGSVANNTTVALDAKHARSRIVAGDLVFAIRGSIGEVAEVPASLDGANITQDTARISPTEAVNTSWLRHFLTSEVTKAQIQANTLGATIAGINIRDLRRVRVLVPPLSEQHVIAEFLDRKNRYVEDLVHRTEIAIERLQEYRTALITAAVTGKIDVRSEVPVTADRAE